MVLGLRVLKASQFFCMTDPVAFSRCCQLLACRPSLADREPESCLPRKSSPAIPVAYHHLITWTSITATQQPPSPHRCLNYAVPTMYGEFGGNAPGELPAAGKSSATSGASLLMSTNSAEAAPLPLGVCNDSNNIWVHCALQEAKSSWVMADSEKKKGANIPPVEHPGRRLRQASTPASQPARRWSCLTRGGCCCCC